MVFEKKETTIATLKKDVEVEEKELRKLMEEKKEIKAEYEQMLDEEKAELEKFKAELAKKKRLDVLRSEGKLVMMAKFVFNYIEEPGGLMQFTKQLIRYELRDGQEYTYLKEVADHVNSRKYPDRALERIPGQSGAILKVIGSLPRCSATIIETFEKEYDEKTDIPDQMKWRAKMSHSHAI